jgi:hypothetical protein
MSEIEILKLKVIKYDEVKEKIKNNFLEKRN